MATFREEAEAKYAPLITPIAGASPSGADVSYDPDFERIKAEIEKLSGVSGDQPNWREIDRLAGDILGARAKDMRVVSWMAIAKLKTTGWAGFGEGLVVYEAIARGFWETMYPDVKRARARLNVFSWMVDLATQHLQTAEVTAAEGEAVRAVDDVLNLLDAWLAEKCGDAYAGPGSLRSLMREKVRAIPAPPPVATPETPGATPAAPAGPPSARMAAAAPSPPTFAALSSAASADEVPNAVRANAVAIQEGAALLRAADASKPWPYRLQRWASWVVVEDPPPVEDGRTRLPPPPKDLKRRLEGLLQGEKWPGLVEAAEAETGQYLFWLDLHRFVAVGLDKMGPTCAAAREVVGRETVAFVSRLPGVADLAFSDGTPFADPGTRSWLAEESKRYGGSSGPSAASAAASAEDEELARRFAEARGLVAGGKVPDGLALALALSQRGADGRARFRARLAVAQLAIDGGRPELARPLLEGLLEQAQARDLESWEPELTAGVYAALVVAARAEARLEKAGGAGAGGGTGTPNGAADLAGRAQFAFERLCRLDPAAAIRLAGS